MGQFMKEDDIYIGTFLDLFNLRFAPRQANIGRYSLYGGIEELKALQLEFQIFKIGRPFADSAALLGLGGMYDNLAKNRWIRLLKELPKYRSDQPTQNGDERIVNALVANFGRKAPRPCYMMGHDGKSRIDRLVKVTDPGTPISYIVHPGTRKPLEYVVISLPMWPAPLARAARRGAPTKE